MERAVESTLRRVALLDLSLTLPFALPIVAPAVVGDVVLGGVTPLLLVFVVTELGGALVQGRVLFR